MRTRARYEPGASAAEPEGSWKETAALGGEVGGTATPGIETSPSSSVRSCAARTGAVSVTVIVAPAPADSGANETTCGTTSRTATFDSNPRCGTGGWPGCTSSRRSCTTWTVCAPGSRVAGSVTAICPGCGAGTAIDV